MHLRDWVSDCSDKLTKSQVQATYLNEIVMACLYCIDMSESLSTYISISLSVRKISKGKNDFDTLWNVHVDTAKVVWPFGQNSWEWVGNLAEWVDFCPPTLYVKTCSDLPSTNPMNIVLELSSLGSWVTFIGCLDCALSSANSTIFAHIQWKKLAE